MWEGQLGVARGWGLVLMEVAEGSGLMSDWMVHYGDKTEWIKTLCY